MLSFVLGLLCLLSLYIFVVIVFDSFNDRRRNTYKQALINSSTPITHHVSSKIGATKITISYNGDVRYLNGNPIATPDDLTEWKVIKNLSMSIDDHLRTLERYMADGKCENFADAKAQWDMYYARLRELCIRHKLWNPALNDRQIFVPTNTQLDLEKKLFHRIANACEIGIRDKYRGEEKRKHILNYVLTQPGRVAVRRIMIRELAGNSEELKKEYCQVCMRMVSDGILSESHDEKGRLLLKKKRARRKKAMEEVALEPSVFSADMYRDLDPSMPYKVKHTVGSPESLDRTGNCCEFHSLSSGVLYKTSLSQCTCPAFEGGARPCKHMVALAKHLGYI